MKKYRNRVNEEFIEKNDKWWNISLKGKWDEKIFWKCYKRWKSMKLDEWNSFKDEIRGKWKDFCMSENRWIQFLEAILWLRNEGKTSLEP